LKSTPIILFLAVTAVSTGLSVSTAWAQSDAQDQNGQTEPAANSVTAQPDRGWNALADALDMFTPSVDTENPPSGEDVNRAIEQQISRDQAQAALKAIEAREAALANNPAPGRDVQLMFQKARALAALGRGAEAEAVYRDMTIKYPELPEPWNNLAILYVSRNDFDQARLALERAIMNNPRYSAAISNLADLQLLMALRDYETAAALGDRNARKRAGALREFLTEVN